MRSATGGAVEADKSQTRAGVKTYAVSIGPKAQDWFDACRDEKLKQRIGRVIDALSLNPHPANCLKLAGEKITWRVRVGDYRILYDIYDEQLTVLVIRIGNRKEIYR